MSNMWNSDVQQQGYSPPQVKLFDPSQFQASVSTFNALQAVPTSSASQNASVPQGGANSWNSWSGWDRNSSENNLQGDQQGHSFDVGQVHSTVASVGQQQQGQFTNAWNQSWDGAGVVGQQQQGFVNQPPASSEGVGYSQQIPNQQQFYDQQFPSLSHSQVQDPYQQYNQQYQPQHSQHLQQQQYDPQYQHEHSQDYQYQQPEQSQEQQFQYQQPVSQHQQPESNTHHEQLPNPQIEQQAEVQQPPPSDNSQLFQSSFFDQNQQPVQGHEYYNQQYNASDWTNQGENAQWTGAFEQPNQSVPEPCGDISNSGDPQISYGAPIASSSGLELDNASQQVATSQYQIPVVSSTELVKHDDDDGTVSGFFGRGDDDGDVSSDSQRVGVHDTPQVAPVPPSASGGLTVNDPHFHRTQSEISNASMSTMNMSIAGDDDDGREALHNLEDLVNRMENVELSSQQRENIGSNLPLDTNIRPSSPDGEQPGSAESGASGGSGGSSGLADWEIVPSQSQMMHSRNSSMDNNINFLNDKPDGGGGQVVGGTGDGDASQVVGGAGDGDAIRGRSLAVQDAEQKTETGQNLMEGSGSAFNTTAEKTLPVSSEGDGQNHQPDSSFGLPPSSTSNMAPPPPPTASQHGDSVVNPFRSPKPMSQDAPSVSQPVFLAPAPATSQPPVSGALDKPVSQSSPDSQQSRGMAALPSKAKITLGSEDGSRGSKQDSDTSSDLPLKARSRTGAERSRRSSRESEEVSSQLRHHSAFHPVSRQRQTAMSPATTLWDNAGSSQPTSNILLQAAVPLIVPALNAFVDGKADTGSDAGRSLQSERSPRGPDSSRRLERSSRERDDVDRSFDSLDELDSDYREPARDRSYRSEKGGDRYPRDPRDTRFNRDHDKPDRPQSRGQYHYDRPSSRADRPSSRTGYGGRDDQYKRNRGYYRDYGDSYYDERYDRPRSRQDDSRRSSRPSSRQDTDRPRSRAENDRDRDQYYRDRHRGYDNYGRSNTDYYSEERERYYHYYKDRQAKYNQGYYEEYYGAKHAEHYLQQHQQQEVVRSRPHSRQDADRASNPSLSRGNTPSLPSEANQGQDYYNQRARPYSRTDYSRDYYYRGYDPYAYYEGYGYDPYTYGYGYPGYEDPYNQSTYDQSRLTPPKYSYPHVRACFGPNGQLVKVLANRPADGQPAVVEVQDVQTLLQECPDAEDLRQFPGPLTRVNTHKKDVLLFCQQRAKACMESIDMIDRESAQLIWRLLELLIKQNGSIVGTDLSDLLLEGHEPSTHEYSLHGMRISQSPAHSEEQQAEGESGCSSRASPSVRVISDRTLISATSQREQWTDRFRHLLLYGRKKDALECAMKNNLWGHALFLASKMDTRTHASVMTRFANSAMRMNDPLQTLYQLMSGRQPAAVTCVVDERWGDWRPHLAMILSNQTSRNDLDRKTICTLGDTLASKGCLHASHFCYLMAQVNFGSYFKKTSKLVLIGASHNLPMEEFATNEAIQCTEVYEYAQTLGNEAFCLPHFQIYKYLYACKLADYGLTSEALHYCEMIATTIQQYPTWFQPPFVKLVFQLSSKLKFSDPQRLHTSEDAEDPMWMQTLDKISAGYQDGSIQPLSGTATPAGFPGTTTSSESGELNAYSYPYSTDGAAVAADTDSAYSHQQHQAATYPPQLPAESTGNTVDPSGQGVDSTDGGQAQTAAYPQQYDYNQWQQHYEGQLDSSSSSTQLSNQVPHYTQHHHQQQQQPKAYMGAATAPTSHPPYVGQHSLSTTEEEEDDEDDDEEEDEEGLGGGSGSAVGFDYFGNVGAQKVVAPPHRYRSLSGSSTGSIGRRRRTTSGSSTGSVKRAPQHKSQPPVQTSQPKLSGQSALMGNKKAEQGKNGSGWFGGILSKFVRKGENEMILPDDKNPPIVWDPDRKKWVNSDGTEEEETSAAPPPKDTDLLGKTAPPSSLSSGAPPPPGAMTAGNRFSLKAKGARNQYVDVNNPKPIAVPSDLFNVMPPATSTGDSSTTGPPQVFMPGAGDANSGNSTGGMLTVSASSSVNDTPTSATTSTAAPSAMPMLFNPATLKGANHTLGGSTAAKANSAGPGLKYGQRRAYPK